MGGLGVLGDGEDSRGPSEGPHGGDERRPCNTSRLPASRRCAALANGRDTCAAGVTPDAYDKGAAAEMTPPTGISFVGGSPNAALAAVSAGFAGGVPPLSAAPPKMRPCGAPCGATRGSGWGMGSVVETMSAPEDMGLVAGITGSGAAAEAGAEAEAEAWSARGQSQHRWMLQAVQRHIHGLSASPWEAHWAQAQVTASFSRRVEQRGQQASPGGGGASNNWDREDNGHTASGDAWANCSGAGKNITRDGACGSELGCNDGSASSGEGTGTTPS